MKLKEIVGKLTPDMFVKGATFDAAAFDALKEALPKQRRNTAVLVVVGVAMLIASVILAATLGGLPVIPCWLAFIAVAASLKVRKWNRQSKDAQNALGISRREINEALKLLKKEYGYISPWKTFWLYAAFLLSFLIYVLYGLSMALDRSGNGGNWIFVLLFAIVGFTAGGTAIIFLWKRNLKAGMSLSVVSTVLYFIGSMIEVPTGVIIEGEVITKSCIEDDLGFLMFIPLILLLTIIPIVKEKKRIKSM